VAITVAAAAYAWWVRPSMENPLMFAAVAGSGLLILLFARRRVAALVALAAAVACYIGIRAAAEKAGIKLSDYRMILYALALILMMILRPQGLFGVRELWTAWRVQPLHPRRDAAEGGKSGTAGKVPTA
jgi:branched-chain amino acid transport system permease protein